MLHKISIAFALLSLSLWVCAQTEPANESAPQSDSAPATESAAAPESAPSAEAAPVQLNPENPGQYVVQKGDTLWGIAGKFLTQPWRWPEIWKANPQVQDPNLIYPGDVITLSYEGGSPVLTADRGGAGGATADRKVKLSPEIRSEERRKAIPTIPIDAIRQFLSRPLIVSEGEMDGWPYVVSSYDQHLVAGTGNRVYVRGLSSETGVRTYSIYRKGPAYYKGADKSSAMLGFEAIYVGEALVESFGDPASVTVTQASREVLDGDRLAVRPDKDVTSDFMPRSPSGNVQGSIISVIDGVSEIGQYQVVVLDVGSAGGVEIGNVLGVYQSGKIVTDKVLQDEGSTHPFLEWLGTGQSKGEPVTLPPESAGVVMVFRTFPQVSYALVMKATGALKLRDTVHNL